MKYTKYKHNGSGTEVKVEGFMPDKSKQWICQVPESQLFSSELGQDAKPQGTQKLKQVHNNNICQVKNRIGPVWCNLKMLKDEQMQYRR